MEDLISQLLLHVRGIWKYRWYAVTVTWVLSLGGWAAVHTRPNDYQSTARVYVDTQTILKPLLSNMTSVPNAEQQVSIMSRTLLSRPNLERVMRMVDLDVRATSPRLQEQQVERLLASIRITGTKLNDIYTITYNDKDPKLVRDVVQALLTIFVEGSFKGKHSDSQKAVKFIDEQIKSYEERLVAAENSLKQFKLRNSDLLPRQGVDYSAQVAIATDALNAARLALMEAQQSRNAIRAQVDGDAIVEGPVIPVRIVNPEIDARITAINKHLDTLRLQYTDQHPDVMAAQRLLFQLEARKLEESRKQFRDSDPGYNYSPMLQQLKVALAEADAKLAAARVRVDEYAARLAHLQAMRKAVPEVESQLAQLNRDYDINKKNYNDLVARRESAALSGDLDSAAGVADFRLIDPPRASTTPVAPNRLLLMPLALLTALAAGLAVTFALSQVRAVFYDARSMSESLGLPLLGVVTLVMGDGATLRRKAELKKFMGATGGLLVVFVIGMMVLSLISGRAG